MISTRQSVFSQLLSVFRGFSMPGAAVTALLCLPLFVGPMSAANAQDDGDGPPEISFTRAAYTMNEGASATITVIKEGEGAVTVNYASADHNNTSGPAFDATANEDYVPVSGELTFGHEDATKTFTVQSNADHDLDEEAESFIVDLSLPPGEVAELGIRRTAVVVILPQL